MEDNTKVEKYIAKTFFGLEEILEKELIALGALNTQIIRRGVAFEGDKKIMYKVNMGLHSGIVILKNLYHFKVRNEKDLYAGIKRHNWEKLVAKGYTIKVESVLNSDVIKHSRYATQVGKDGIVDYLREKQGYRPNVSIDNPDVLVHINVNDDLVRVSVNTSGDPLFKRGYRKYTGDAPINEVLASGILSLMNIDQDTEVIDGMCGSGTFPIEAALLIGNIAPNKNRSFAFQKFPDYDKLIHKQAKEELEALETPINVQITGSDLSNSAVEIAKSNAEAAGVLDHIKFYRKPFKRLKPEKNSAKAISILNPPYGVRLQKDEIIEFYKSIGDVLKNEFHGFTAGIISSEPDILKHVGLRPQRKIKLFNGGLECKLHLYQIFDGTWNEAKEERKLS